MGTLWYIGQQFKSQKVGLNFNCNFFGTLKYISFNNFKSRKVMAIFLAITLWRYLCISMNNFKILKVLSLFWVIFESLKAPQLNFIQTWLWIGIFHPKIARDSEKNYNSSINIRDFWSFWNIFSWNQGNPDSMWKVIFQNVHFFHLFSFIRTPLQKN